MPTSSGDTARPEPVLVIDGLTAGYGGPPVISEVSCQVGPGEIVTVVGPNGAGKSTLLKAVAGLLPVSAGSVRLNGQNITARRADQLARLGVGFVPQDADVFATLTVAENLEMGGYLLDRPAVAEQASAVLDLLPALKKLVGRKAEKLSGGERKMTGIARALMNRPSVLLLDEPTAGLSPELSATFLGEHVARLAERGTAILLVEQKALAALAASTWGVLLAGGHLQLECPAQELAQRSDIGELFLGRRAADAAGPGLPAPATHLGRADAHRERT